MMSPPTSWSGSGGITAPSTTVVTKWKKRDDVCSDSDEQWLGECAEKTTSRGERERRAVWIPPSSRKVAEFRGGFEEPSRASQPPQAFERTQALRGGVWLAGSPSFFFLVFPGLWQLHLTVC